MTFSYPAFKYRNKKKEQKIVPLVKHNTSPELVYAVLLNCENQELGVLLYCLKNNFQVLNGPRKCEIR